ncbi:restriction endonuclease subunit S [Lactobacillus delbrueckii]|uniref:restriction endonuclease subunit S n=1 Tax=Lactobacillus delbrueckii TaxID=1584 RepID=UPI0023644CE4|nr:restriction endonuclease subunit S [Lactobacillus delbrueckii]MDD1332750.1 restriction endonuclease subunit S [Lactobacillus delbrueckii subsp. lactis]
MKDEKKAPKLRFKGFTDDWEQCKLSDISEKSYEKNTDNKYSTVLTNSAEYGIVKQRDFFDKDIANSSNISGYYVVRKNYFVYNPRISNQAKFGPINRNKLNESGIMSPLYLVFTVHDIDESFLETLFQTTTWHRFMYQNGDTGARADRFAIKDSTFMSMPIKVPSLEEQHKLALAFQKLDQTITLHEEKKHQLERLKSALLQKMFADESGYPVVRFEGFSDEWEQCKLGDVADRVTTKNKGMVSELPLTISAQDGLISQDEFFNKKVASKDLSSYLLLHHGDFAYNKSYSNGYPFGTIKRLEKYPQGVVSSLYIAFKPNSSISSDFMAQYYESNNWHKEIYKCAAEGARNHGLLNIPPSDFFATNLNIPITKSEQLKIGRLLNAANCKNKLNTYHNI